MIWIYDDIWELISDMGFKKMELIWIWDLICDIGTDMGFDVGTDMSSYLIPRKKEIWE